MLEAAVAWDEWSGGGVQVRDFCEVGYGNGYALVSIHVGFACGKAVDGKESITYITPRESLPADAQWRRAGVA